MCVISMVMDIGKTMLEEMWNPQTIDDFRKMTESARRIDTNAGQKDCVDPEKEKFMERLKLFERRYELSKRLTELRELTAEAVMELSDIDEKLDKMRNAVYSPCKEYRYTLYRDTGFNGPTACFIMANPSTATDEQDDATIRKVQGFARVNGWGRILIGNIFAYRSTDIKGLGRVEEPIGQDNDLFLAQLMSEADITVFAWGNNSKFPKNNRLRWLQVAQMARELNVQPYCIGRVSSGHPRHPLMTRYGTPVSPWNIWNVKE